MKILVNEKLSEHKYKTAEGYLICTDAILARTGKQSYTKDELFGDGDNTEVNVDRPYDQVMNAKTIASFENKPITFDHPDEDVNVGNYKSYAIGYVRDVHQGKTKDGEDVIMGNLVITDQDAINAIEEGSHTDLSCGYDCDIVDAGNGNYAQNNIRGNHVALCEQGRAGIAHIVDSKVKDASYMYEGDFSFDNGSLLSKYHLRSIRNGHGWSIVKGSRTDIYLALREIYGESIAKQEMANVKDSKQLNDIVDSKINDVFGEVVWQKQDFTISYDKNHGYCVFYKDNLIESDYDNINYAKVNVRRYAANIEKFKKMFGIKDSVVDSKTRDLVNDSGELVVGRWYDFAKKIEVERNQYATSLRISGKSGNVYRYTIYLKNGEVYGSGTYSEIKERFNIKDSVVDSKVEDDETIDYKGIKIGVLHTSIGTLYEVRYNKNKADWPEYKKLENAKKYIDIFLTKGEQAANASWKIDDTIADSKIKDFEPFFFKNDDIWEDEAQYVGNNLKVEKFIDKYDNYKDFVNNEFTAEVLGAFGNTRENAEMLKYFEQEWPQKAKLAKRLFGDSVKDFTDKIFTIGNVEYVLTKSHGNFEFNERKTKERVADFDTYDEAINAIKRWTKLGHITEDSKVEDSLSKKEKELCDYMLENALDDGEDENDLLKKMKVYYSEYSNLARSKSNEVLQYFKSHIDDNKIEDSKEMTMSDAIKMLNIVDIYKKVSK